MKPTSRIIMLRTQLLTWLIVISVTAALPWMAHAAINPSFYLIPASEHLLISVVEQSVTDKVAIVRAKVLKVNRGSKAKVGETILIRWADPGKVWRPGPDCPESRPCPSGPQEMSSPWPPAVGTTVPAYLGFTCQGASDCFYWPAASQYSFGAMN